MLTTAIVCSIARICSIRLSRLMVHSDASRSNERVGLVEVGSIGIEMTTHLQDGALHIVG